MPRSTCLAVLCSLALALSLSTPSPAQTDPVAGIQPFSVYGGGQYDAIDAASGNIVLQIPVISKTGKIPFSYQLVDNVRPYVYTCGGFCTGSWMIDGRGLVGLAKGFATLSYTTTRQDCSSGDQWLDSNFIVFDSTGAIHPISGIASAAYGACQNYAQGGITIDHTGYALTAQSGTNSPIYGLHDRSGDVVGGGSAVIDPDGVGISATGQTYTDTLGQTVLTVTVFVNRSGPNATSSPDTYVYKDAKGNDQTVKVNYTSLTELTNFACTGIAELGPGTAYRPTSVVLADGQTIGISYEATPGNSADITGRIKKITLPTGGYVQYDYSGGPNGMNCSTQKSTITRTVNDGNGHNSVWTYVPSAPVDNYFNFYTTITDPAGNTIVDHFHNETLTQEVVTDKNLGLLSTKTICSDYYYSSQAACVQPTPTNGTVKTGVVDIYTSFGTAPTSLTEIQYDFDPYIALPYGNVATVKRWATGAATFPPSGTPLSTTTTTYANISGVTCGPASQIHDRPCSTTTTNSAGATLSKVNYTYNSTGHPTQTSTLVAGSTYLNSFASYNANGTIATSTDVNNAVTHYYYNGTGGCNNLLLTSTLLPVNSLTTSQTWDCVGGVLTSTTDANSQVTNYGYLDQNGNADPLWRLRSTTDPLNNTTWNTYSPAGTIPATLETAMVFNTGLSTADQLTTFDGLGRPILQQTREAPGSTNFDTVSLSYDANGRLASKGMPCVSNTPSVGCTATATVTTYDALNRPLQVTDGGGGYTSYTYTPGSTALDVLATSGPAPSGENLKKRQLEYDGLGRLASVCELTSAANGGGNCVQNSLQTGFWTKYTYDGLDRLTNVSQSAQSAHPQARTYSYDDLSRLTSEANPESGTTTYTYDTNSTCGTYNGDLVKKVDAASNVICFAYDPLHRGTGIAYPSGPYASSTPPKTFAYDATTFNCTNSTHPYVKGRLAEAFTGPTAAKITDTAFCYSARGEVVDDFESTPNSAGYYHTTATYWANGGLNTLNGIPTRSLATFGVDGEGRPYSATYGTSMNWVTGTTYYPSQPQTTVTFGTGDSDVYSYNASTARMNQFQFTVGATPKSLTGVPGWSANGTLGTLGITDQFNAANSQNCTYVHDDLSRIQSVNCLKGSTNVWNQTFTFDAFGNISKSGTGAFAASYLLANGTTNNQEQTVSSCVPTYDPDGNLTRDCAFLSPYAYAWDADGNPTSLNGVGVIYDALDREVEITSGSTHSQVLYGPIGKLGVMNGQTPVTTRFPLPGGSTAEVIPGSIHILHSDWLGSARLSSFYSSRTVAYDTAYAPYGESYNGTSSDLNFTGQSQDTLAGLYDFLYREYSPAQGRWISPDPAGVGAADPGNPQSWNRYAYVLNNPLALTDPTGLDAGCNGLDPDMQGTPGCELSQAYESYMYWYTNGRSTGASSGSGFNFGFNGNFDFGGGGIWGEWQLPMPGSPAQALQSVWADALGLPTGLNCPQVGGISDFLCGGVSPASDWKGSYADCVKKAGEDFSLQNALRSFSPKWGDSWFASTFLSNPYSDYIGYAQHLLSRDGKRILNDVGQYTEGKEAEALLRKQVAKLLEAANPYNLGAVVVSAGVLCPVTYEGK